METHVLVDPHLESEKRDTFQYDVPVQTFLDAFLLPSDPLRRAALLQRIDAILAAIASSTSTDPYPFDLVGDSWMKCTSYGETKFLPAFCRLLQSLIKQSLILSMSTLMFTLTSMSEVSPTFTSEESRASAMDGVLLLSARGYRENRTRFLAPINARQKLDFYVRPRDGLLQ